MQRIIATFLIATTLLLGAPLTAQAASRHDCAGKRVRWLRPALGVQVIENRVLQLLIPCVVARFGPPPAALSTVQCIANRESHGYPYALNASGSAGVFQLISWQDRARVWLHKRWFPGSPRTPKWSFIRGPMGWTDARANSIMAIEIMHGVGLSPWANGRYDC